MVRVSTTRCTFLTDMQERAQTRLDSLSDVMHEFWCRKVALEHAVPVSAWCMEDKAGNNAQMPSCSLNTTVGITSKTLEAGPLIRVD